MSSYLTIARDGETEIAVTRSRFLCIQRFNDDGEPSGTAGAPMLEVLRGREVSDVTVGHADAGKLENELRARGVTVRGVDYAEVDG